MTKEAKGTAETEETPRRDTKATTTVVYRGSADAFEHGKFTFRPGQPVAIPSDVAEDLLTYPYEKFEEAKE